jgi:ABC-type molybdate transport system ATPase subunit
MVGRLCTEVIVLDDGLIAASGPADRVLGDRRLLGEHGLA